jgi:alkylmercury lyase
MNAPRLDEYWTALADALPELSPEHQKVAVVIYRELAKGDPLGPESLAAALAVSPQAAREQIARGPLRALVYSDAEGRVAGFGGLAATPMHHEFRLGDRKLWTWCAWDSLFIPRVLGETAEVTSRDPETAEIVRLTVSPRSIERVRPEGAVVSFLFADAQDFDRSAANVMAKFCHRVFFFASAESGERWTAKNPGTFAYSTDEAFELGRRLTARLFGLELPGAAR